jgi:hypothetical protein
VNEKPLTLVKRAKGGWCIFRLFIRLRSSQKHQKNEAKKMKNQFKGFINEEPVQRVQTEEREEVQEEEKMSSKYQSVNHRALEKCYYKLHRSSSIFCIL